jgi:hypothetical protein
MTITLTDAEQSEATAMLAALHESGYVDVEAHGDLRPGVRIRHRGHQWPGAYANGTGNIVAITRSPRTILGVPDVELIAVWDREHFGSRLSQLAQYHVDVVGAP